MVQITLRRTAEDTVAAIFDTYVQRNEWRRDHLGASILGHKCDRYLWLSFRWAQNPGFDGRKLRLFDRGDLEEHRVLRDLRRAGFTVTARDENRKQFRFKKGHIGGSCDGFVEGLPESKQRHLLEIKTANSKRFARFQDKGVRSTSEEYYCQVQLYMAHFEVERALVVVVEKDTDNIYCERIHYDWHYAQRAMERAQSIVRASEPPEVRHPKYPPCKYTSKDGTEWPCDFYDLCHGQALPERNCRTCVSATPIENGQWVCDLKDKVIGKATQRKGCKKQMTIPPIIRADIVSLDPVERLASYAFPDGTEYNEGGE